MIRRSRLILLLPLLLAVPILLAFRGAFVTHILSLKSENPAFGVPLTVWTADVHGMKNGTTQFTREYNQGSQVAVTAPATHGAKYFEGWKVDGIVSPIKAKTFRITMDGPHTLSAVYVTAYNFAFNSTNPNSGVPISIWTADLNGQLGGNTSFTRTYADRSSVSATAPAIVNGNHYFVQWNKNGSLFSTNRTVDIPVNATTSMNSVYATGALLTVASRNPDADVPITIWVADKAGKKNGVTTFTRVYAIGVKASATAPATAGGKSFLRWEKDGNAVPGTSKTITVDMDTAHTITAVYGP